MFKIWTSNTKNNWTMYQHICGSTISSKFVLTGAHCFNEHNYQKMTLIFGNIDEWFREVVYLSHFFQKKNYSSLKLTRGNLQRKTILKKDIGFDFWLSVIFVVYLKEERGFDQLMFQSKIQFMEWKRNVDLYLWCE